MSVPGGGQNVSWRRLNARMLLVHPVRELGQAIPALIGLVLAGRAMGDGQMWWLAPVGVVVVITLSVLRWLTTTYRITPEQVQLRTGLLQRKTISTPADRVRTVHVTASALHRILGLAKVEIGTGSHESGSGLSLDSLGVQEAAGLRAELLHRSAVASPDLAGASAPRPPAADVLRPALPADEETGIPDRTELEQGAEPDDETELARLDPGWVRFSPFTMSGVLSAAAILGIGSRLFDQLGVSATEVGPIRRGLDYVGRNPVWLDVVQGLLALFILVTVLSIGGYILSYWGFRLTRHPGGSLQITRGLLTTRATSIEERRLRGVELAEPLLQRAVRAARLSSITTGLKSRGGADGGSSILLPPAPRGVAREVAAQILRDSAPLDVALTAHGPAARRRRFTRALLGALVLIVAAGAAVSMGASPWVVPAAALAVPVALLLAVDRYRSLGHAIAGRYLVTRAGSLSRRRDVIECDGIIGWNVRQTFFQRRAGLSTLTATTAAGRQRYAVTDVPLPLALALASRALPGLLDEFLVPETPEQR
ncbi:MAG: PH domain-containing protein [Actinomycetota bacterium]